MLGEMVEMVEDLFSLVISGMEHSPFEHTHPASLRCVLGSLGKQPWRQVQLCSGVFSVPSALTTLSSALATHSHVLPYSAANSTTNLSTVAPEEQLRATLPAAVSHPGYHTSSSQSTHQLSFLGSAGEPPSCTWIPGHTQKFWSSL